MKRTQTQMVMEFSEMTMAMRRLIWAVAIGILLAPALAWAQSTDEVVYYHTDAIGSVRMITDATGTVIDRYDFLPFGERWAPPPQPPPDARQFAGTERDAETGLDYFGARYYHAQSGRFTTVDPVLDIDKALADPQQWQRYAYVRNNPFRYVDQHGAEITTPQGFLTRSFAQQNANNLRALGKSLINVAQSINSPGHMTAEAEARHFAQPDSADEAKRMQFFDMGLTAASLLAGIRGSSPAQAAPIGEEIGILRGAAGGRGNFGLGAATANDAGRLGRAWVGEGYTVAGDGKTLLSRDGLRQYRPPSFKPQLGRFQANFEQRPLPFGGFGSNGHLDITDIYR